MRNERSESDIRADPPKMTSLGQGGQTGLVLDDGKQKLLKVATDVILKSEGTGEPIDCNPRGRRHANAGVDKKQSTLKINSRLLP